MKHLIIFFVTMSICWVFYCIIQLDPATTPTGVEENIELTYEKDLQEEAIYQPKATDDLQNHVAISFIQP